MTPTAHRRNLVQFDTRKRAAGHILGLAAVALRLKNVLSGSRPAKKVLILEPFGLGDIISFEPLVRILKQHGYQIALCGKREWKALYPEDNQLKWIAAELPWSVHSESK